METYMTIYHLFHEIYVLLDDGDRRALSEAGLTPTQYNLLSRLQENVVEGHTVTELAELLLCTRSNITRLVQRLKAQGLVEIGGDVKDQRLVRVALTPEGLRRLNLARQLHQEAVKRRLDLLSAEKRAQLMELTSEFATMLKLDLEVH